MLEMDVCSICSGIVELFFDLISSALLPLSLIGQSWWQVMTGKKVFRFIFDPAILASWVRPVFSVSLNA